MHSQEGGAERAEASNTDKNSVAAAIGAAAVEGMCTSNESPLVVYFKAERKVCNRRLLTSTLRQKSATVLCSDVEAKVRAKKLPTTKC